MRFLTCIFFLFYSSMLLSQDFSGNYRKEKVAVKDTIVLDSAGIHPKNFRIQDKNGNDLNPFGYRIDFKKGKVYFPEDSIKELDSVTIHYLQYPSFLTREYFLYPGN